MAGYIDSIDPTSPLSSDDPADFPAEMRLFKGYVKDSFPNIDGAVNPTPTEFNYMVGVTSAIQAQLNANSIGRLLQRESTVNAGNIETTTTIPYDDTIPQITEGVEVTTVAITPTAVGNLIEVTAQVVVLSATTFAVIGAVFIDSTANALAASTVTTVASGVSIITIKYQYTAVDTAAHTFKLRIGSSAGDTVNVNGNGGARRLGGVSNTYIQADEISQ